MVLALKSVMVALDRLKAETQNWAEKTQFSQQAAGCSGKDTENTGVNLKYIE